MSAETGGFNPSRKLCSDGTCIGVIGDAGRCNVCGRPASGAAVPPGAASAAAAPEDQDLVRQGGQDARQDEAREDATDDATEEARSDTGDPGADATVGAPPASGTAAPGSGFDPTRKLCPDGTCLGVLGRDGRCPICGTSNQ